MLRVTNLYPFLIRNAQRASLQISITILVHVLSSNEKRRVIEQRVHLFQWNLTRLRKESPEEEGVGKVANDENKVVSIANCGNRHGCYLPDHRTKND